MTLEQGSQFNREERRTRGNDSLGEPSASTNLQNVGEVDECEDIFHRKNGFELKCLTLGYKEIIFLRYERGL